MIIFHKTGDLTAYAAKNPQAWRHSGFVPTMGALHEGHISLIQTAKAQCRLVVASIFINPTQFNDPADFEKYPKTISQDIEMLEQSGCDVLFLPKQKDIYPFGLDQLPAYDLGSLEHLLEGYYRPGHFQGVCQVVHRLLTLVNPSKIFMGQKDFQQCMVVKRLIALENLSVSLLTCPTLREKSGLAMSSRNMRLSEKELLQASNIYKQMVWIEDNLTKLPLRILEKKAAQHLLDAGFSKVDYISIAEPNSLEPLENYVPYAQSVVLVAAFIGEIRLIDNMTLK